MLDKKVINMPWNFLY